jgi:hypothetical protein
MSAVEHRHHRMMQAGYAGAIDAEAADIGASLDILQQFRFHPSLR